MNSGKSSEIDLTTAQSPPESKVLPFTGPWLLAPMDGVTNPVFRSVMLALHRAEDLGGAFTEFVRVVDHPVPSKVIRRHLGEALFQAPVGLQFMANHLDALAGSIRNALEERVPLIDLNFGCPAKGPVGGCVGSAMLKDPSSLERTVNAAVKASEGRVPITAKIRAGFEDAHHVEDLARAVEAGGAQLLTIHCRTRKEGYQDEVDWTRIARAVGSVSIKVCGNGGIRSHEDFEKMRARTGCELVMVGRGALSNPWIFSGKQATIDEAWGFLKDYASAITSAGALAGTVVRSIKQLVRRWTAAGILDDEAERKSWLRERDDQSFLARLDRMGAH